MCLVYSVNSPFEKLVLLSVMTYLMLGRALALGCLEVRHHSILALTARQSGDAEADLF